MKAVVVMTAIHVVIVVRVKIKINNIKKEVKMEAVYVSVHVCIKNNSIVSMHMHIYSDNSDTNMVDWNFNYYKKQESYIDEIVLSDEIKGVMLYDGERIEYCQTVKSDSITDAISTVLEVVNCDVMNVDFTQKLKLKKIQELEKQSQELIEKAKQLKGDAE